MEYTFSYIKPTAVRNRHIGDILNMIENAGFDILSIKKTAFTTKLAEQFYAEHKGKDFFERLIEHCLSGSVVALILEKENAIEDFRTLIGNTTPSKAKKGTIRAKYGETVTFNAIHGSDSTSSAKRESQFFFSNLERF